MRSTRNLKRRKGETTGSSIGMFGALLIPRTSMMILWGRNIYSLFFFQGLLGKGVE